MAYSTDPVYNLAYGSYKKAESDVQKWIRENSEPPKSGNQHKYSYYGKLAKIISAKGLEMPENIKEKLKSGFLGRCTIAKYHLEKGDSDEGHDFPMKMFGEIVQLFFERSEAKEILAQQPEDYLVRSRDNSPSRHSKTSSLSSPTSTPSSPSSSNPYVQQTPPSPPHTIYDQYMVPQHTTPQYYPQEPVWQQDTSNYISTDCNYYQPTNQTWYPPQYQCVDMGQMEYYQSQYCYDPTQFSPPYLSMYGGPQVTDYMYSAPYGDQMA